MQSCIFSFSEGGPGRNVLAVRRMDVSEQNLKSLMEGQKGTERSERLVANCVEQMEKNSQFIGNLQLRLSSQSQQVEDNTRQVHFFISFILSNHLIPLPTPASLSIYLCIFARTAYLMHHMHAKVEKLTADNVAHYKKTLAKEV